MRRPDPRAHSIAPSAHATHKASCWRARDQSAWSPLRCGSRRQRARPSTRTYCWLFVARGCPWLTQHGCVLSPCAGGAPDGLIPWRVRAGFWPAAHCKPPHRTHDPCRPQHTHPPPSSPTVQLLGPLALTVTRSLPELPLHHTLPLVQRANAHCVVCVLVPRSLTRLAIATGTRRRGRDSPKHLAADGRRQLLRYPGAETALHASGRPCATAGP